MRICIFFEKSKIGTGLYVVLPNLQCQQKTPYLVFSASQSPSRLYHTKS